MIHLNWLMCLILLFKHVAAAFQLRDTKFNISRFDLPINSIVYPNHRGDLEQRISLPEMKVHLVDCVFGVKLGNSFLCLISLRIHKLTVFWFLRSRSDFH